MEIEPTSFKVAGRFCGVNSKKLYRWYKESLSGYDESLANGEIGKYNIMDKGGTIKVPIVVAGNIGESMAIDEKYIGGEFYTIISNNETNKIAVLAKTTKIFPLGTILKSLIDRLFEVRRLTRDLDYTYENVGRQWFMNAMQVADKFHVLRHAFDALQTIRIKIKDLEQLKVHALQSEHYKNEFIIKQELFKKYKIPYTFKEFKEHVKILDNEESVSQLLARSRYLLFKQPDDWNKDQERRALELFSRYPLLREAYDLIGQFRRWYNHAVGASREIILASLNSWYEAVKKSNIQEVVTFSSLVKRHEGVIINHFIHRDSNAKAEALNAKIQRFIVSNYGKRDEDFFFFRLAKFFA